MGGPRPIRKRGDYISETDQEQLTGSEVAMRRVSSLCNHALHLPSPAFVLEQPEHPERWSESQERDRTALPAEIWCNRPDEGFVSFWSTPEWSCLAKLHDLKEWSFDQGPLGHCKRKPTTIGTNLPQDERLLRCRGPGVGGQKALESSIHVSKMWAAWAPGLVDALQNMLSQRLRGAGRGCHKLQKLDASFIEHIRQQHIPYRRDCQFCVKGGGRHRQHRRILAPQAWTLAVDTAGPLKKGVDEFTKTAKFMAVGVLTIPKIHYEKEPTEDPIPVEDPGIKVEEVLEDAGWLGDSEGEDIAPPGKLSPKEAADAAEEQTAWEALLAKDQAAWKEQAEVDHMPRVEMIEWVMVEPVASKSKGDILTAIGRMVASAHAEGFEVARLHSDRGREYHNTCSEHGAQSIKSTRLAH